MFVVACWYADKCTEFGKGLLLGKNQWREIGKGWYIQMSYGTLFNKSYWLVWLVLLLLKICFFWCAINMTRMETHSIFPHFLVTDGKQAMETNVPSVQCTFSALTLLVERQEGHLACKNWMVGCWCGYLSWVRCRFAYGPTDFWYGLNWIVPDKIQRAIKRL